ncbi:hypothetical protein PVAP13_4KG042608 [Panicum virgatum]|uniref:Uncharacterized protein n=1 Tax=Panicum virgatum TaxID=38727 RepID=A0A8T0TJD9_PANVG|nr:hypothetical protein PVAP13_4KG042608 [Panicum virgatum]
MAPNLDNIDPGLLSTPLVRWLQSPAAQSRGGMQYKHPSRRHLHRPTAASPNRMDLASGMNQQRRCGSPASDRCSSSSTMGRHHTGSSPFCWSHASSSAEAS